MSDLEFDRFIKKEFSALTLDKLRMLSEGAMFSYADLHKVYLLGKKSLRAEIERKDEAIKAAIKLLRKWNDSQALQILNNALSTKEDSDE